MTSIQAFYRELCQSAALRAGLEHAAMTGTMEEFFLAHDVEGGLLDLANCAQEVSCRRALDDDELAAIAGGTGCGHGAAGPLPLKNGTAVLYLRGPETPLPGCAGMARICGQSQKGGLGTYQLEMADGTRLSALPGQVLALFP